MNGLYLFFGGLRTLLAILLVFIYTGCERETTAPNEDTYNYFEPPPELNDGWNTGGMSEAGLNYVPVKEMLDAINNWDGHGFNGILIVKNNKLVFEKYYPGKVFDFNIPGLTNTPIEYTPGTLHFLASQSKSVTSLLFGIASDKGYIGPVTDSIKSYFSPEYASLFTSGKERITIRHLLTMSSGMPWSENPPGTGDIYYLFRVSDPVYYLLNKPLETTPGTFHYNSGSTNLLAEIIYRKTNLNLRQFADENLFTPLGIDTFDWKTIRGEHIFASGGLFLTPRSMAKIGQLCLNKGLWNGKRIVSEEWIDESTKSWIYPTEFGIGNGYGYQWWLNDFYQNSKKYECYFAAGWGEQMMYVFPQENMIVLFFGEYYTTGPRMSINSLVSNYVLRALQ